MAYRPLIVVATPQGQLGNTLVHFAHLRAFAMQKRLPLIHLAFERYAPLFPAANRDLFSSYAPDGPIHSEPLVIALVGLFKTFLSVLSKTGNSATPEMARMVIDTPPHALVSVCSPEMRQMLMMFGCALTEWILGGQFQSMPIDLIRVEGSECMELSKDPRIERLLGEQRMLVFDGWTIRDPSSFAAHKKEIVKFFTPGPEIQAAVGKSISTARARCSFLVGVHIRRGDYKNYLGGKFFYDLEQYVRWMSAIRSGLSDRDVGFLVCSDETLTKEQFAGLPVEFGPGSAAGDMYSLARCDAMFGPPSTFTAWAANMGDCFLWYFERPDEAVDEFLDQVRRNSALSR